MKKYIFHKDAFEDFVNWSIVNKNVFKRIAELLKDIGRNSFEGIGKPEPLKHNLKGCWSRRITDEHRLVYDIDIDGNILIISCKGHYNDL
jgi:toxin YoeB